MIFYDKFNIQKYLMNKNNTNNVQACLPSFREYLPSMVNSSDHIKCISLNNQQCMIQSNLINLS